MYSGCTGALTSYTKPSPSKFQLQVSHDPYLSLCMIVVNFIDTSYRCDYVLLGAFTYVFVGGPQLIMFPSRARSTCVACDSADIARLESPVDRALQTSLTVPFQCVESLAMIIISI